MSQKITAKVNKCIILWLISQKLAVSLAN
jgi:hypothetical protein